MQWVWKGQGLGAVRMLRLPDALLLLPSSPVRKVERLGGGGEYADSSLLGLV